MSRKRCVPSILIVASLAVSLALAAETTIFGSKSGAVYHTHECGSGKRVTAARRLIFKSEAEAIQLGRRKCKSCARLDGLGKSPASQAVAASGPARTHGNDSSAATEIPSSMPAAARVAEVLDGDTLRLENGDRVRLMGVSCPEADQRLGAAAKRFVEEQVYGKTVRLGEDPLNARRDHRDQWNRWLAYVRIPADGRDLSEAIIDAGLGWCDAANSCSRKESLMECERKARAAQRGLWKPLPGDEGRRSVFISTSGQSFHGEGCLHLRRVKTVKQTTLNDALAAGYHPCPRFSGL